MSVRTRDTKGSCRAAASASSDMPNARRLVGIDVLLGMVVVLDIALLGLALITGRSEVADGAGRVTTGNTVALSILASLALAALAQRAPVSARLRQRSQLFVAASICAHALGHLARLYYLAWWYDDVLHMVIPGVASVLAVRISQELTLFPKRHSTRVRAAFLAALFAIAIAGLWEIFEFSADELLDTREQDDLRDTMQDMIDGLVGGFFAAVWSWKFPRERRARSDVANTPRSQ